MTLVNFIKDVFTGFWQIDSRPWWIEIITIRPECTYYFGPFHTPGAAKAAYSGYIDDLKNEGSEVTNVVIKRCEPKELTLCDEEVA